METGLEGRIAPQATTITHPLRSPATQLLRPATLPHRCKQHPSKHLKLETNWDQLPKNINPNPSPYLPNSLLSTSVVLPSTKTNCYWCILSQQKEVKLVLFSQIQRIKSEETQYEVRLSCLSVHAQTPRKPHGPTSWRFSWRFGREVERTPHEVQKRWKILPLDGVGRCSLLGTAPFQALVQTYWHSDNEILLHRLQLRQLDGRYFPDWHLPGKEHLRKQWKFLKCP